MGELGFGLLNSVFTEALADEVDSQADFVLSEADPFEAPALDADSIVWFSVEQPDSVLSAYVDVWIHMVSKLANKSRLVSLASIEVFLQALNDLWDGLDVDQKNAWNDFKHFFDDFCDRVSASMNVSSGFYFKFLAFDFWERFQNSPEKYLALERMWEVAEVNLKNAWKDFQHFKKDFFDFLDYRRRLTDLEIPNSVEEVEQLFKEFQKMYMPEILYPPSISCYDERDRSWYYYKRPKPQQLKSIGLGKAPVYIINTDASWRRGQSASLGLVVRTSKVLPILAASSRSSQLDLPIEWHEATAISNGIDQAISLCGKPGVPVVDAGIEVQSDSMVVVYALNPGLNRDKAPQEVINRLAEIEGSNATKHPFDRAIKCRIALIRTKAEWRFPGRHCFLYVPRYSNMAADELARFGRYTWTVNIPQRFSQCLRFLLAAYERQALQDVDREQHHHQSSTAANELAGFLRHIRIMDFRGGVSECLRVLLAAYEHQGNIGEQHQDQAFQGILQLFVYFFKDWRGHGYGGPKGRKRKVSELENC